MSSVRAITTCSAAGWEAYGRRMAQTWVQHWPVPLTVWAEGFEVDVPGVDVLDLCAVEWLAEFKRANKHRPTDNYRLDAVRFAHKTAAVIESGLSFDCDYLIWVDADTVTHAPVPQAFVETLLPREEQYIAWLERVGNYPECGFYVLSMKHGAHYGLMRSWRTWYRTGELFQLPEWHDSYVLQQLVARSGAPWKSLSGVRGRCTGHPFVNGPLGAYMDHMKGDRKSAGRSRRKDLRVHRTEAYWKGIR